MTTSEPAPPLPPVPIPPFTFEPEGHVVTQHETDLAAALRWVIEHKSCSGFPACWVAAPAAVRASVLDAWGSDPWPALTERLPHADVPGLTPETCPEREAHGKPFRFCPVKGCGWHDGMPS